ncbi:uncharacterized protein LOC109820912 [Asparagus officinalis]|uniref:uncharacterized protein LOC109820912 n=1 Tax=Asparagus officinalis TaxID=4686 RepID=UPI00098DE4EA|nr:uncharacterized protein LOC109820912 [Asparagus officinalis]
MKKKMNFTAEKWVYIFSFPLSLRWPSENEGERRKFRPTLTPISPDADPRSLLQILVALLVASRDPRLIAHRLQRSSSLSQSNPSSTPSQALVSLRPRLSRDRLRSPQDSDFRPASKRPYHLVHTSRSLSSSSASLRRSLYVSGLKFADYEDYVIKRNFSELHRSAKEAWDLGLKVLKVELEINNSSLSAATANEVGYNEKDEEACPPHVMLTGGEFTAEGKCFRQKLDKPNWS